MVRRYVLPCALILAVSIATAGLASKAKDAVRFRAACTFRAYIVLSRKPAESTDNAKFINSVAGQKVASTVSAGAFSRIEAKLKVKRGTISRNTVITPPRGLASFSALVVNAKSAEAVRLTNAVCDGLVESIKADRAADLANDVKVIRSRMASEQTDIAKIEKKPAKKRSAIEKANLATFKAALVNNAQLIANIISLPPDDISVKARAPGAAKVDTRQVSKHVAVGGIGGLLACFLYILIGETIVEHRRRITAESA